ncbi:MAG: acyltransferase [Candidatus Faecousia sp.]|nr:acyltransferase [Candidatus Faecousia sp.]
MLRRILSKLLSHGKSPAEAELNALKARGLRIGEHVDIFTDYPFDSLYPGLITVGDYVTISSNVRILAHDASMGYLTEGICKIGVVEIGNHVFIGHGATILCNVRIGDYAVIGAGSVVTCDVPAHTVYAGNPARFVKTTEEFQQQHLCGCETHPTIHRPWRELTRLRGEEWNDLREQLKDTYGYIVRKKKDEL